MIAAVILLANMISLPAFAADATDSSTPTITVGTVTGTAGYPVDVPVILSGNTTPGTPGIAGYTFTVTYDTSKLTYTGYDQQPDVFKNTIAFFSTDPGTSKTTKTVTITASNKGTSGLENATNANGNLVILHFQIADGVNADIPLTIGNILAANTAGITSPYQINGVDGAIKISSDTTITNIPDVYTAAYVGERDQMPGEVKAVYSDGSNGFVQVTWDDTSIATLLAAKTYDTVTVTGTAAGLPVKATVEVIPHGLVYYIDSGTIDDGSVSSLYATKDTYGNISYANATSPTSQAYKSVKAKEPNLRNGSSDKFYADGAQDWGLVSGAYQFAVAYMDEPLGQKLGTGYVGWDDRPAYADKNKYIEYKLYLPKGDYAITTGHYCWWNQQSDGGYPRTMDILFNDNAPVGSEDISFNGFGQSKVVTYNYHQAADGVLDLKVATPAGGGDGATLSFIGVAKASAPQYITPQDSTYNVIPSVETNFNTPGVTKYMTGIATGTTFNALTITNQMQDIEIYDSTGTNLLADSSKPDFIIGTGMVIKLIDNSSGTKTVIDQVTAVVKYDLTGDGKCGLNDVVMIRYGFWKLTTLNEAQELAAGVDIATNTVTLNNVIQVLYCFWGI